MSLWFSGLKYAEDIGVEEAEIQLFQHEFEDSSADFDRGVRDYLIYAREHLNREVSQ